MVKVNLVSLNKMINKNSENNLAQEIINIKKDIKQIKKELTKIKKKESIRNQKFVLFKGKEGLADRLQCLLQIIKYSIATDRTLIIDWRDEDWTHEIEEPINTYFEFKGIKNMSLLKFFEVWKENKENMSVFPHPWKKNLEEKNYSKFLADQSFQLPNEAKCIEEICQNKIDDFQEDIVVYPGILHRSFDTRLIKHIVPSIPLKKYILDFSKKFYLKYLKYDVIHLRGASKNWMGGELPENSPVKDQHNQWENSEEYLNFIWQKYTSLKKYRSEVPLYLISDSYKLISLWQKKYSIGIRIPNLVSNKLSKQGIHKLNIDEIGNDKEVSKKEINYECIRDFALMLNSRILIGDGVSLYSEVALMAKSVGITLVKFDS